MPSLAPRYWSLTSLPPAWRTALSAVSMLWFATALGAGLAFLTQAVLARKLGPASYGLFASSLAMVTIVAPLAGFGLAQFWLKVFGGEGWAAERWLQPSARFLAFTTALTVAIILAWALLGAPADATITLLVLLPIVPGVLGAALISSKLRLEERHLSLALWQLTTPGSRFLVALLLLLVPHPNGHEVAIGYGLVSVGVALLAAPQLTAMMRGKLALHGHGPRPPVLPRTTTPSAMQLWSQAWAFGLAAVLYPIFFQISTVLMKYFDGNTGAGIFGIGLAVMSAVYLIPSTLYQKFLLSKQQRWAVHDPAMFWRVYRHGNLAMLASGVLLGGLVVLAAPWAVPFAFGVSYQPVVPVLLILSACIPLRFLSTSVGSALLNERHMRYRVYVMGFSAAVVVALDFWLIPRYHERGAAIATVAGETVLLMLFHLGVNRFHPHRAVQP